jgi:hypothetical protein
MLPRVAYGNSHLICGTGFAPPWIFMNPQNVVHGDHEGVWHCCWKVFFKKFDFFFFEVLCF